MRRITPMIVLMSALGLHSGTALADAPKNARPHLDVSMDGPHLKYPGRTSTYLIKVTNPGDARAKHVVLRYQVPASFQIISISDDGHQDLATKAITWKWTRLRPEETREVKILLGTQNPNASRCRHECAVTAEGGLHDEVSFGGYSAGLPPLLLEVVDLEDPVQVGGIATYEVRLTNTGSEEYTTIRLRAKLPLGMTLKSVVGPATHHQVGDEVIFEPIEKLAQRQDAVFRIECKVVEHVAPTVRFLVTVTSDNEPEPIVECEATSVAAPSIPPSLFEPWSTFIR